MIPEPNASAALCVILLLDSSASMHGAPLESLRSALHLLCSTFISRSKRPVQIAMIAYESEAKVVLPLVNVQAVELPKLDPAGASNLGKALGLAASLMGGLAEGTPALMYILTDGDPTDDWQAALTALRPRLKGSYGVFCGMKANADTLKSELTHIYYTRELTPDLLFDTFRVYV